MRVAVCFYGITRCLEKTLPEIERNLLGPLRSVGASCEIFLHCLTMDVLSNELIHVGLRENGVLDALGPSQLASPTKGRPDEKRTHCLGR